jgi:gamma-glutamyl-gamma-aminobutyrate hydrolase PuuD
MPKVGICRGAQLLNIFNGGSLWQDVDNHNTHHPVRVFTYKEGAPVSEMRRTVNSVHHQMCRVTPDALVLATAAAARQFKSDGTSRRINGDNQWEDIEAFFYSYTNSLGIQWHPEYGHKESLEVFNSLFYEYAFNLIDFGFEETTQSQGG